ncbi:ead/Ea22-like family protein [Enterobacter cloacae subsp. cloacae]|uniref:ead/Ea22-like family protein n=1 Tax=Enterobacter cloacae complex TaxID=354276 RepID=UPI0005F8D245|nr:MULTISPECIES: ead/Ea22-like family protein [Enterobacter cloacae complex]EKV9560330.1 ead/Ea22-like family protein [Enterobacter hormaechei]HCU1682455.1 ead/Ea22-like family protein [Escherichia coli]EKW7486460.1 ead/Ea22-like family protein [Enterobacter hormaechei]KJX19840.1 hypothetical protein SG64_05630 [Enterobacter hormaechei subsp. xiangfangensis]MDR9973926.1 ead/Ea22-like family protein [Enterobacter cloacae subsp. cloacae]
MSNIDKRALREAAEKAGSDKWQAKKINGDFYVIRNGSYEKQHGFTSYQPIAEIEHKPVRDFVAAANPATVLALLDELETADALNKHLELAIRKAEGCSEKLRKKAEAAEERVAELEAREVKLPQRYSMLHRTDFDEPYQAEMVYKQHQVLEALHDAGIRINGEV